MEGTDSPASNQETGSLTQPSPHESRFVGSSSGVYFINTVKKAFESSLQQEEPGHLPAAEETVGGEDDFAPSARNSPERGQGFELNINHQRAIEVNSSAQLGSLPLYETAQQLVVEYFRTWHPIVPFLSGPAFLQEMDSLYQDPRTSKGSGRIPTDRQRLCNLIIFQSVLAVGASGLPVNATSQETLPSRSNLLALVASLASKHDLLTIQALLAAQVYCVSTLALRTASSIGGILCKLLYHAGLHRCPYRYPQLSNEDRDLRKRILWSAYAIDRYLCQALGIPVSLSDAEIDVCLSGRREIHGNQPTDLNGVPITPGASDVNEAGALISAGAVEEHPSEPVSAQDAGNMKMEVILANFVEYGRLVGNLMEIFHVSLHARKNDTRKVLFLRSDVDKWFNSMPSEPTPSFENTGADEQTSRFLPFLHVLYEQLKISIHRPSLSLPRSTPEFHHSLQVTIRAAKRTILAMEKQAQLFWPGFVASVWMSGLIISFACQIGMYNVPQGTTEIKRCLDLLKRMGDRWRSAQRCHAALSTLLSDLQRTQRRTSELQEDGDIFARPAKRQRTNDTTTEPNHTPTSMSPPPIETPTAGRKLDQHKTGYMTMPIPTSSTVNEWDVNDFFQDISWEHLFDMGDVTQDSDMQLFAK